MAFIPIYDTNPLRNIRRPWVAWGLIVANVLVYFLVESGTAGEASDASLTAFGLFPAVFSGVDVSRSALLCGAVLVFVMRRKNTLLFDRAVDDPLAPPIGSPPTQEPRKPWG